MKRHGRFSISKELLKTNPWMVQRVMSQCIIFRAEYMYMGDVIEYHATSYRFDLVKAGEVAPEYVWKFDPENDIEAVRL